MFSLEIKKRDLKEDVESLRASGKVPAVFYGKKEASTPITVVAFDFVKLYKQAGESSVIILKGDGMDVEALVQDVNIHPVTGKVRHVDFYVFEKGKKIKVEVPLDFIGNAPAIKELGGSLIKVLHALEIEALPKDLPNRISVDIASLVDFKSVIAAKDIKLPKGVELVAHADEIVVSVAAPKAEEVVAAPTMDISQIEVAKKGKEVKEGAEGEAAAPAKGSAKPAAKK
jgi:large subunit ribosomal protein L25